MNYSDLSAALTVLAQQAQTPYTSLPTDFVTFLPRAIDYAEGRIYRSCVFLAQRSQDSSLTFTPAARALNTAGLTTLLVVEGLAMIIPAASTPAAGTRVQCDPMSLDFIDSVWPVEATTQTPTLTTAQYFCLRDDHTIIVAPTPDAAYKAEITGIFRPAAISAVNPTTYLATTYGELLLAACMISVSGYLRDYGSQSDDPKLAVSWEDQFGKLLTGVEAEERRRRFEGTGWAPYVATPQALPPRS